VSRWRRGSAGRGSADLLWGLRFLYFVRFEPLAVSSRRNPYPPIRSIRKSVSRGGKGGNGTRTPGTCPVVFSSRRVYITPEVTRKLRATPSRVTRVQIALHATHDFQWDAESRLKTVDQGGTMIVVYNALGQQVKEKEG
jgi:hypothetical protein